VRGLLICPGRGSYGKPELGSLDVTHPIVTELDSFRSSLGRMPLTELDFSPRLHVAGEHASLLTFACSALDLAAIDPQHLETVAVIGNSMGWYTALYAAGVLDLSSASRLIETMGHYQSREVLGVCGGQLLYPVSGEDWRLDARLQAEVDRVLGLEGVHLSIRLGGTMVLAGDHTAIKTLQAELPKLKRGAHEYPLLLPLHSAFHTPLLAEASERALVDLADLPFGPPKIPLVAGNGQVFRAWCSLDALRTYTLTTQVLEPYDFTRSLIVALGDYGPDVLVLPGPGSALAGAIAQTLIGIGWRGLRDREDFIDAQKADIPLLAAMCWPGQRKVVTANA
jgi:acyl transferase domain-containing protein